MAVQVGKQVSVLSLNQAIALVLADCLDSFFWPSLEGCCIWIGAIYWELETEQAAQTLFFILSFLLERFYNLVGE